MEQHLGKRAFLLASGTLLALSAATISVNNLTGPERSSNRGHLSAVQESQSGGNYDPY